MKYSILIITICLLSCKQGKSKFDNNIGTKHDTVIVKKEPFIASVDSTIQTLLMEYYTAGLTDATNSLIELYNTHKFNDSSIEKQRMIHLKSMKQQLASKK